MANLTVTIAVATGTQYQVGGSGNVFTFDGSQPASFTFPWVNGGTVRLEQSGSTNDGHPLIFSTSNSTTLSTMRAGIISSGVTYYLDGSSNQSDYTNTTTFNAATTRYIEIAPSSESDFYFACWVHGISMGGIVDVTQDTWGALNWSDGEWERQNDSTVSLTGIGLTSSITVPDAYNEEGWGRYFWGQRSWGVAGENVTVSLTGVSATTSAGDAVVEDDIEVGWGRDSWGNEAWGVAYSVIPTGASATASAGDLTVAAGAIVSPTGTSVTASLGDTTPTGQAYVTPTGVSVTGSIGDVIVNENEVITPTGIGLTSYVGAGQVVGGTVVSLSGIGMTASLGDETAYTDVTIIPTGVAGTSGIGTATVELLTNVAVSGIGLTGSLGDVSLVAEAHVFPTGIGLTATADAGGGAFAWAPVDKGDSVTWSAVDKTAA